MIAAKIITFLLILGGCWLAVKYLIFPRLPSEQPEPEHIKILQEKIDKLHDLREELEAAKAEKDVTAQLKNVDEEIEKLIGEISDIENA